MKNYVQPGEIVTLLVPNPGPVTKDVPVQIGQLLVVPTVTVAYAAGATFTGVVRGVFDIVKNSGEVWTEGALVYWDAGNSEFTTTAGGNHLAGFVAAAAENLAVVGRVLLDGVARADES